MAGADAATEQVRIEVADVTLEEIVTTVGFGEHVGPVGDTTALRVTEPANPLAPVTVIVVEASDEPAGTVRDGWLAATVKSTTLTVKSVEFEIAPEAPLTVKA